MVRGALLIVLLISVAFIPVVAQDYGGSFGNTTEFTLPFDGDPSLGQGNRLSLFARGPLTEEIEAFARVRYEYRLDTVFADETDTAVDWWQGDLDALYLRGRFTTDSEGGAVLTDAQFGRFVLREFSGALLRERLDGVRVSYQTPLLDFTVGGGYTGLLMKESSNLLLSQADVTDDADEDVYLAPPRLLGLMAFSFPDVVPDQTLDLAFILQYDARDPDGLAEGQGLVHTGYLGGGFSGPLAPALFYDAYGYFGVGSVPTDDGGFLTSRSLRSYLAGVNFQYFLPEAAESIISFGYLYSSGDKDHGNFYDGNTVDESTMFIGLTPPNLGVVFSPRLGNLMVTSLGYSAKPLNEFQTALTVLGFFRPTTGVISEVGINPASDSLYLGTEVDLALNFRPFSDLGMSLRNGIFFPNTGDDAAFLEDARGNEYKVTFDATFSF
jgi:hypothetical protein